MNKKWIAVPAAALVALSTATAASAVTSWGQGFEYDTAGWSDSTDGWYGSIERVASGTDGISSASGKFHAQVNGDTDSAPFSRFAGYSDTWQGPWVAEMSVYLDPAAIATGEGYDFSVSANGSDNAHQRDFIFHVTKDSDTGSLLVAGSNNTGFAAREDLETRNHYEVTEAGWYTMQHSFYEKDSALAVDLNLLDSSGEIVFTETRSDTTNDTMDQIGGNRYSWFTFATVDDLAVDNHKAYNTPAKAVSKDNCKDGSWEGLGFKNQGQCVASAQANNNASK